MEKKIITTTTHTQSRGTHTQSRGIHNPKISHPTPPPTLEAPAAGPAARGVLASPQPRARQGAPVQKARDICLAQERPPEVRGKRGLGHEEVDDQYDQVGVRPRRDRNKTANRPGANARGVGLHHEEGENNSGEPRHAAEKVLDTARVSHVPEIGRSTRSPFFGWFVRFDFL